MSVLARYRKPGGFRQLLMLIETSQPAKQEKLLEVVAKEDPDWADLIQQKKITKDMVFGWSSEHLVIVLENMNIRHCIVVLKTFDTEKVRELCGLFHDDKFREVKPMLDEDSEASTPTELNSAFVHMLETVRYLDEEKKIDLRYIDPALDLSDAA